MLLKRTRVDIYVALFTFYGVCQIVHAGSAQRLTDVGRGMANGVRGDGMSSPDIINQPLMRDIDAWPTRKTSEEVKRDAWAK